MKWLLIVTIPQRMFTHLQYSSSLLCQVFLHLSSRCFGFSAHNFTDVVHSHCSFVKE